MKGALVWVQAGRRADGRRAVEEGLREYQNPILDGVCGVPRENVREQQWCIQRRGKDWMPIAHEVVG